MLYEDTRYFEELINMGRRKVLAKSKEHITRDVVLSILKTGALLGVAITAPNAIRYLKGRGREAKWEGYYPSSIERQTMKLWRKGFVRVHETGDGHVVEITQKGIHELLKYDLDTMRISKPDHWDRKWRMVFFDVVCGNDEARKAFQSRLKQLGFFQMQKSVYICPFPCEKEIMYLREVMEIPHSVKLATIERLENDEDLRRHFHLI